MGRSDDADALAIAALLANIQNLRLTLAADLSVAAAALEENEPAIARDIVAADRSEVRRLSERPPSVPRQRSRRRRALLALPAIPLVGALAMTGAAAVNGTFTTHHTARNQRTVVAARKHPAIATTPAVGDVAITASSTLRQLERAVDTNQRQSQVTAVADHLHHQLTAIIATSHNRPSRLVEVKRLLSLEQQLLEGRTGAGAISALAASRELTKLLTVSGVQSLLPTSLPTLLPTLLPSGPLTLIAPHSPTPTHANPKHSSKPTTSPSTSQKPTPSPTTTHHHHRPPTNPLLGAGLFNVQL